MAGQLEVVKVALIKYLADSFGSVFLAAAVIMEVSVPSRHRPDMEIKIFRQHQAEQEIALKELWQRCRDGDSLVVRLAENIHGNIFNKPFPFVHFRRIPKDEKLPEDLKKDGDPWRDYFTTLRSIRREKSEQSLGFVFMGFKVLNDDHNEILDTTWKEWTGVQVVAVGNRLNRNILPYKSYTSFLGPSS